MPQTSDYSGRIGKGIPILFVSLLVMLLYGCSGDQNPAGPVEESNGVSASAPSLERVDGNTPITVLAYNDLGMHCMNEDFSQFLLLPPCNNLHAQVIAREAGRPRLVTTGVTVHYAVPFNSSSAGKTNFWRYVPDLLGVQLAPGVGLTGNRLAGAMKPAGVGEWCATAIPLTPLTDFRRINPFQLSTVVVTGNGGHLLAATTAVIPVSWEISCDLCHHGAPDAPVSVLEAHDLLHGTSLYQPNAQKPVLCGHCHAQPELGLPGDPARRSLSVAMHFAHAGRMMDVVDAVPNGVVCYACHPGLKTQCLRDVHAKRGMTCMDCHAGGTDDPETAMLAVGDPGRTPWTDEPRCGTDACHHKANTEYEQAGTLFRNSRGHGGIYCEACHNSTHAVSPSTDWQDNMQSVLHQGSTGTIRRCTVCHAGTPAKPFVHRFFQSPGAI